MHKDALLVRVVTDDAEGWGECAAEAAPTYAAETLDGARLVIRDHLAPRLFAGPDFDDVRGNHFARYAVEIAAPRRRSCARADRVLRRVPRRDSAARRRRRRDRHHRRPSRTSRPRRRVRGGGLPAAQAEDRARCRSRGRRGGAGRGRRRRRARGRRQRLVRPRPVRHAPCARRVRLAVRRAAARARRASRPRRARTDVAHTRRASTNP